MRGNEVALTLRAALLCAAALLLGADAQLAQRLSAPRSKVEFGLMMAEQARNQTLLRYLYPTAEELTRDVRKVHRSSLLTEDRHHRRHHHNNHRQPPAPPPPTTPPPPGPPELVPLHRGLRACPRLLLFPRPRRHEQEPQPRGLQGVRAGR